MNKRRIAKRVVVLAVIIIGLFLAAVGAGYFSYGHTTRAKISEGMIMAGGAKAAVAEYFGEHGEYPVGNAAANLDESESITSRYVTSVEVIPGGRVVVTMGGHSNDEDLRGIRLELRALAVDGQNIKWTCTGFGVERKDLPSVCRSTAQNPDLEELNQFAARYAEAWSGGDPAAFAQLYAEDGSLTINDGQPSVGRGAVEQTARSFMTNFPDMVVELVELRIEAGRVAFHWHWTGTNTGPGGTGNSVDLFGYEEWALGDDGLILESLGHLDDAEYQRQLHLGISD
jgi:uncharacterized protein (TIGR02246 family)